MSTRRSIENPEISAAPDVGLAEAARNYWKATLAALPNVHNLPLDRQRPAHLASETHQVRQRLDATAFMRVCAEGAISIDAGLVTMLAVWLARESGESDVVIGLAGEPTGLILRHDIAIGQPVAGLLQAGADGLARARRHASFAWSELQALARAPLTAAHAPLAQIVLACDKSSRSAYPPAAPAALHDVTVEASAGADGSLVLEWRFAADLFDPGSGWRLAAHFVELLKSVDEGLEQDAWQLPMMDAAERETVLHRWNDTAAPFDARALHEQFATQVAASSDRIALSWGELDWSYAQLDARSRRIAQHLVSIGVAPGDFVGVCMQRSPDMVAGLLAIWMTGAAYVALDPNYPSERIAFMLSDSGARCVLTQDATRHLIGTAEAVVLDGNDLGEDAEGKSPLPQVAEDALAYIIYTSGSTGTPKGVCIEHRQAAAMIDWARGVYDADVLSGVLAATSICFDLSVFELFVPLCSGGRAVVVDNALDFARIETARGLKLVNTVPSAIKILVEERRLPAGVRIVNLAGEALAPSLVREIYRCSHVESVYNLYGPSEDTTYSTWAVMPRDAERSPIGRPLTNGRVYVLDARGEPQPIGVVGEIYVAGAGVARGYWNRPELTHQRFLPDSFDHGTGQRMYRTGDLGRWLPNGQLEFLGRSDHQIKLRGFRIELGEIEGRLIALEQVEQALVLALKDTRGDKQLIAYVVPADAAAVPAVLVEHCKARLFAALPEYMVPAAFVVMGSIPLTPNGKVDRAALPVPEFESVADYVEPDGPLERELAEMWQEILKLPRPVGAHDDFFALGGHSLVAMRLLARVQQLHGAAVSLRALFESPTPRCFAAIVERGAGSAPPAPRRVSPASAAPLTFMQRQLWFIHQLDEGSAHYHMQSRFELVGDVDSAALRRALVQLVRRHESLRTVVSAEGGELLQRVVDTLEPGWQEFDLRESDGLEERRSKIAREDSLRPFLLQHDCMIRATLVRLAQDRWELLLTLHHIAGDGWSLEVLMSEVGEFYRADIAKREPQLPQLPLQYLDYAMWQREYLKGERLETLLNYWSSHLEGMPSLHRLPLDRPRPPRPDLSGAVRRFRIEAPLVDAFRQLCRRHNATLSMGLQGIFALLLARHSGECDIVVSMPVANRELPEVAGLIGLFTNALVLRSQVLPGESFIQILERQRGAALGAYAHQQVPFELLTTRLKLDRGTSHSTFTQIMFALQNSLHPLLDLGDVECRAVPAYVAACPFELSVEAGEDAYGIAMDWMYRVELFDEATIARLADHFVRLLQAATHEPWRDVWALPLLSADERALALALAAGEEASVPQSGVHDLFAERATLQPQSIALIDGAREITYAELQRISDQLAHHLRALGVLRGDIVGVALDRSIEMVVAQLATLKVGAAYLPLDTSHPVARIEFMLADSRSKALVTTREWSERTGIEHEVLVCMCESAWRQHAAVDPTVRVESNDPAYLIYTSGSTGSPKGALNSHAGLVNLCAWHARYFQTGPHARFTVMANVAFDATVLELWPALLAGACLVIVDDTTRVTPHLLATLLREQRITHCFMATGLLEVMAETEAFESPSLRVLSCGGDRLQRNCLSAGSTVRLINLYGPTEATVLATAFEVPHGGEPLIGKPIDNVRAYVLNRALEHQPVGVVGELYLGGACVGLGYLNAPDLTSDSFVADPLGHVPGALLYRTRDLVRRRDDGNIEFIGRADQQIKLRGFRIELGEIETRLQAIHGVRNAVVLLHEDAPGRERLIAYVACDGGTAETSESMLRAALRRSLPEYMQPHALVVLEAFPLTASGKIDRAQLPIPIDAALVDDLTPLAPTATALAALWCELLQIDSISGNVNFFDAGGHSLLIARLIHSISLQFGVQVSMRDVFNHPTVRGLAAVLDSRERLTIPTEEHAGDAPFPLSHSQFRVWYLEQSRSAANACSIPCTFILHGVLDANRLERALDILVERHAQLRTHVVVEQGVPLQRTVAGFRATIERADLSALSEADRGARLEDLLAAHIAHVFDLQSLPLFRIQLIALTPCKHIVHMNVHHLVFDGWSYAMFCNEWLRLYDVLDEAPPATPTYAAFVHRQIAWLESDEAREQQSFWRDYLSNPAKQLSLSGLRRWPRGHTSPGARRMLLLPRTLRERVSRLAREHHCWPFVVLYGSFALLLGRLAAQSDFNIGIPVNGRQRPDVQDIIGNFLNNLPVRNKLDWNERFTDYLKAQFRNLSLVLSNQDLPFERILEVSPEARSRDATPLFQVFFNMFSQPEVVESGGLAIEFQGGAEVEPKFELTLYLHETQEGIELTAHYDAAVFAGGAVEHLLLQYEHVLDQISADPQIRCGDIELRLPAESERQPEFPQRYWPGAVHTLFERRARSKPSALAIVEPAQEWNYGELLDASLRVAVDLQAAGVGRGDTVAIVASRSAATVIAVLGTLQAGAAFSLLDPDYPSERVGLLAGIVAPRCILFAGETDGFPMALLEQLAAWPVHVISSLKPAFDPTAPSPAPVSSDVAPDDLACITFTSGTTGVPKPVAGVHIGLSGFLAWYPQWLNISEEDCFSMLSGLGHDPLQRDIFTPLCLGARIVIPPPETIAPQVLAGWFAANGISFAHMTPALAQVLCASDDLQLPALRVVFLTGEALRYDRVAALRAASPELRVINSYGTTETQRGVTYFEASSVPDEQGLVPAGECVPDTVVRVFNAAGRPCGLGEIGDIFLESHHLSLGYRNDAALTARVLTTLESGARLYRTGDLGCRLPLGRVAIVGRGDQQLNLRGFRIEVGEIEAQARAVVGVRDVTVVMLSRGGEGNEFLVAYVVPESSATDQEGLLAALSARFSEALPSYMVPSTIVFLAALPLTPNGKLDRQALPQPALEVGRSYEAPRTALEAELAAIWAEVLRVERVGVHDNFFELGGHSMLQLLLLTLMRKRLNRPFHPRQVLPFATVREQAEALSAAMPE